MKVNMNFGKFTPQNYSSTSSNQYSPPSQLQEHFTFPTQSMNSNYNNSFNKGLNVTIPPTNFSTQQRMSNNCFGNNSVNNSFSNGNSASSFIGMERSLSGCNSSPGNRSSNTVFSGNSDSIFYDYQHIHSFDEYH